MKKIFSLILIFFFIGGPVYAAMSDNLVSVFHLEDVNDSVGSNTLTNTNSVTFVSGKFNNAAHFVAASSQRLSITDASQTGLDFSTAMSGSLWFKQSGADGTYGLYAKQDQSGSGTDGYECTLASSSAPPYILCYYGTSNNNWVIWTWQIPAPGTTWHHVVFVFDSTQTGNARQRVYYDGSGPLSINTQGGAGVLTTLANTTVPFYIGARGSGAAYFNGDIDEVNLWSRALTTEEATLLYNQGNGWAYPYNSTSTPATVSTPSQPLIMFE